MARLNEQCLHGGRRTFRASDTIVDPIDAASDNQPRFEDALGRSVRSCSQTIPEALAKIWRAAGSKVKVFSYMVRKLRSIAFQRCI